MKKILITILAGFTLLVTGCARMIPHYKLDVEQGNLLSKGDVNKIQVGMTKTKVIALLGTPPIIDSFHADRWDYVYTLRKGGKKDYKEKKRISLFFSGEQIVRIEGNVKPDPNSRTLVEAPSTQEIEIDTSTNRKPGFFKRILKSSSREATPTKPIPHDASKPTDSAAK